MLKIRTGNDWVSEQTRELIRRGCYGDSDGKSAGDRLMLMHCLGSF